MTTVNVKEDGSIEGYITLIEWANKNGVSISTARYYIQSKRLDTLKIGNVHFIKEDIGLPALKNSRLTGSRLNRWVESVCSEVEVRERIGGYCGN